MTDTTWRLTIAEPYTPRWSVVLASDDGYELLCYKSEYSQRKADVISEALLAEGFTIFDPYGHCSDGDELWWRLSAEGGRRLADALAADVYRLTFVKPSEADSWSAIIEGERTFLHLDHQRSAELAGVLIASALDALSGEKAAESPSGNERWVMLTRDAGRALVEAVS